MPTYEVTSPDGKTWEVNAPEGATQDQVLAYAKQQWSAQSKPTPAVVSAGSALNDIPRQLGLTARYGLEGLAQAAEIGTEPIRRLVVDPAARALGIQAQSRPLGAQASMLADSIGLPKPQNATERVVGDASRLMAGAGGLVGGARQAARLPGMAGKVGTFMAQNPTAQLTSAAGAGGAAGASREAGGSPTEQALAGLIGGLAAPAALSGANRAAQGVRNTVTKMAAPRVVEQHIDNQIELTLRRAGVNWRDLDEATRRQVRQDVQSAVSVGDDLNADALRRLVDFRRVGATPTRGGVTLDPVQITRERNLSKIGANSSDQSLQTLAQLENQNNATLIRNMNDAGAARAPDPYAIGDELIGALQSRDAAARGRIGSLYQQARDSSGRSAQLDGAAFTQRANQLLQENLAGKLPGQIEDALNNIAAGKVPLTVDHAEQLKTVLARIQRSTSDGNERYAMGLIRQALDETPLRAGNQVGQDSINAFGQARSANRAYMGELESNPALAAAVDGAAPDNFFNRFVVRGNVGETAALRNAITPTRINPENLPATAEQIARLPRQQGAQALEATKNGIVDYLKRQALGGAADEVGNFSQSAYNKALREIGDRKLGLFFSPQEIQQLKAVGRVASYTQFQPRGSAVNNSNSGALAGGMALDWLNTFANRLPLGLKDTVTGTISGMQARQAMNVGRGLLTPAAPVSFADAVGPQALIASGLLAPQMIPNR